MTTTIIDDRKAAADYRIIYANGGSFTVARNPHGPVISGRGVKRDYGTGSYEVTSAKLADMRKTMKVEADF